MKVIKKNMEIVKREGAHGGSGGRRLYLDDNEIQNVQGMTYGYLPVGRKFEWHNHDGLNEVMLVLKGRGVLRDEDGEYPYEPGDFFILPDTVFHEMENTDTIENEMVFVRIKI